MKLISIISPTINLADLALVCAATDAILLRQDAVYLCLRNDISWPTTQRYALDSDIYVRHVLVPEDIVIVTAKQWLELTINAKQNLLWQN